MNADSLRQKMPNADPDFINIICKLHDPSPKILDRILDALPELHGLFLKKRRASLNGDADKFMKIVEKEVELIRLAERG